MATIRTILVGGVAGEGVRSAGAHISQLLIKNGYEIFTTVDYPSLIRGGHNFVRISFSEEKVYSDYKSVDLLVAFDEETIARHKNELAAGAVIIANSLPKQDEEALKNRTVIVPIDEMVKAANAPTLAKGTVAFGAVTNVLGLSLDTAQKIVAEAFSGKDGDFNELLLEKGFSAAVGGIHCASPLVSKPQKGTLLDASTTVSNGMVKAGLNFFVSYPMTPASPVLHYLAKKQKDFGITVIHPENELSAINMSMGVAYGGKRVATGTAGGGFALMQETFSFAGISELPIVVLVVQRPAPGTGVPTYTSQSDLFFSVCAGHGEFPRIVLAPGDAEEAYYIGGDALNLAWKYQVPVIVLMDKHLAESGMSGVVDESRVTVEPAKMAAAVDATYNRYAFSEDGVSPIAFAGAAGAVVKMTSYEHDESGIVTEDAAVIVAMNNKRFAKEKNMLADVHARGSVRVYGDVKSKNVLLTWGSTKGAVLEANKYLKKPAKIVQVVSLAPLDTDALAKELKGAKKIVDIELNHESQLAALIRQKMGIEITKKITRYDGRPFETKELAQEIENKLK